MNRRLTRLALLPAAFVVLPSAGALAQHAGDIGLALQNQRITTGTFSGTTFIPGERVFVSTLGTSFANFASDPGFDCLPGTFAPGSRISFTIMGTLRVWSNSSFGTVPEERLQVGFATFTPVLTPLDEAPTPGFSLAVASNGEWHRHLQYTLLAPADDGVYLLALRLSSDQVALTASDTFWIVFNQNRPASEVEAAAAWVQTHLVGGTSGACNLADVSAVGGTAEEPGTPDGQLTVDDLIVFVNVFIAGEGCPGISGPCNRADVTGVGGPPEGPDAQLTVDDLIAFVNAFSEGC